MTRLTHVNASTGKLTQEGKIVPGRLELKQGFTISTSTQNIA